MIATRNIFVFDSNDEGNHGAGAAYFAKKRKGAIQGQARGLQGDSWAIVTKVLRLGKRSVTLESIQQQVVVLIAFAREHEDWAFTVTPIGCGLPGFTPAEIAPMFRFAPKNMLLSHDFKNVLNRAA
jgi:hypothetical protein